MAFLSDLATKAAAHNVGVVLYSGNDGAITPHLATEVIIQVCPPFLCLLCSQHRL